MIVGIVLAGGRSSRFGRDKLAEPVGGEPLLLRPIRALVAAGCSEVVVVLGPDGPKPEVALGGATGATVVRFVRDPEPFGGPLVGLRAGLAALDASDASIVLVVGGDQPTLEPAVLGLLASRVRSGAAAVVLADPGSHPRPLPAALSPSRGLVAADRVLSGGRRRLRDLLDELAAEVVDREAWRRLDPSATTLVDIDEPGDLP